MSRTTAAAKRRPPAAPGAGGRGKPARGGFSLVELLVVIAIIVTLVAMTGAAVSSARAGQKRTITLTLIQKLDGVISQQYATYGSRSVPAGVQPPADMAADVHRSWYIRRHMINGDLPDRWIDVQFMAANESQFTSPTQRGYIASWNAMAVKPTDVYQGAECLFMIVMQGGIASCLDCNELQDAPTGDKDNDGAFEFWDAWGNPIAFLLWPAAVKLPAGSGINFFSGDRALEIPGLNGGPFAGPSPSPGLGMRPLIYSAGADGEYGFETRAASSNLSAGTNPVGRDCGNWQVEPASVYGTLSGAGDTRDDNVTNFDVEAAQ